MGEGFSNICFITGPRKVDLSDEVPQILELNDYWEVIVKNMFCFYDS